MEQNLDIPYATLAEQKCLRDGKPIGQSKK